MRDLIQGMRPAAIGRRATMTLTVSELARIAARCGVLPSVALEALLGEVDQFSEGEPEFLREPAG